MGKLYISGAQTDGKRERRVDRYWTKSICSLASLLLSALIFHLLDACFEQTSNHWLCPGDTDMSQTQFWLSRNSRSHRGDEMSALTLIKSRGYRVIRHMEIKHLGRLHERDIRFSWEDS